MKKLLSRLLVFSFVLTLSVPFTGLIVHKLAATAFLLLCLVHIVVCRKSWASGGGRCWAG